MRALIAASMLLILCVASAARAQCPPTFTPTFGSLAPFSAGVATSWDPDGSGPHLVASGDFADQYTLGISMWTGSVWQSLGLVTASSMPYVSSMTSWDPDGDGPQRPLLVVAGFFDHIDGVSVNNIAAWDGAAWHALGAGTGGVSALTTWDPDGNGPLPPLLVAGGSFHVGTGSPFDYIAAWDGANWRSFGWGFDDTVYALTTWDPDGAGPLPTELVAGGNFQYAGADSTGQVPARGLAAWDGVAWHEIGGGIGAAYDGSAHRVSALTTWNQGGPGPKSLVVSGDFGFVQPGPLQLSCFGFASWDGSSWNTLGNVATNSVVSWDPDGPGPAAEKLIIGGSSTNGAVSLRRWDSDHWTNLTIGTNGYVNSLSLWQPDPAAAPKLIAIGAVILPGSTLTEHIVGGDRQSWSNIRARPLNAPVRALAQWDPDGSGPQTPNLVAGGEFTQQGDVGGDYVSYWDQTGWHNFGWGTDAPVNALTTWDPDGSGPLPPQLIAAGEFIDVGADSTGTVTANHIARWDGQAWRALSTGIDGTVYALTTWDPDGPGPLPPLLIAGGDFHFAGGSQVDYIAAWDGTSWHALGWGFDGPVHALTTWDPDGSGIPQLIAGGDFTAAGSGSTGQIDANGVARWDGSVWRAIGSLSGVRALTTFNFDATGSQPPRLLAADGNPKFWDGTGWNTFNNGFPNHTIDDPIYHCSGGVSVGHTYSLAVWDPDGSGPVHPQLFTGGVENYSGIQCGKACSNCQHYDFNIDYLARWNGTAWTSGTPWTNDAIPATTITTFDQDGDGPLPPILVAAGPTAPYVYARTEYLIPVVTTQPQPATAYLGEAAAFQVGTANGASTYQWYKEVATCYSCDSCNPHYICFYNPSALVDGPTTSGSVISGATTPTLIISDIHGTDATAYYCVVGHDACNSATSDHASLALLGACTADFNGDGDVGTDLDIEAFFACLGGDCCPTCGTADFNGDGDVGTDQDIDSFFRVLGGGNC